MAQAQNSQLAFTVNNFSNGSNNAFYIGFKFSVTSAKTVNQLGILNTNSHTTLPGNTVVVAAVVPAGTTPTSAGALGAFMVSLAPTVLAPGNHVLLAETGGTHEGYGTASLAFQAGIGYVNG